MRCMAKHRGTAVAQRPSPRIREASRERTAVIAIVQAAAANGAKKLPLLRF